MRVYKLTDKNRYTRRGKTNETLWHVNVPVEVDGIGTLLCSSDVIHFYNSPEIAAFMDPVHGVFGKNARLWEADIDTFVAHDGTKGGTKRISIIREIALPTITLAMRVRIAKRIVEYTTESTEFTALAADNTYYTDVAMAYATKSAECMAYTAENTPFAIAWAANSAEYAARAVEIVAQIMVYDEYVDGPKFAARLTNIIREEMANESNVE